MDQQHLMYTPPPPAADLRVEKRNFSRIGLSLAVYLLIVVALQTGVNLVFAFAFPSYMNNGWYLWAVSYLPQLFVGTPVCLLMLRAPAPPVREDRRLGAINFITLFVMCVAVAYIGSLPGSLITVLLGGGNPLQSVVTDSNLWATALFAVLLAPVTEELIFRRAIIGRLRQYGDKTAILISALLFALLHGNFAQVFYAFGLGVLLGYVYVRTGRLRYSIALHMLINFQGSVVAVYFQRMADGALRAGRGWRPGNWGLEQMAELLDILTRYLALWMYGLILLGIIAAGLALLISEWKRAVLSPARLPLPKGVRGGVIFGNFGMIAYLTLSLAVFAGSLLMY